MTFDITDATGSRIGRVEDNGDVYDKQGYYIGRVTEGKTLDKHGSLVARGEVPGLLLEKFGN